MTTQPTTPSTPAPDYTGTYNQYYGQISDEVNKYVDELVNQAQGNYDFAAKWIENNYKMALGNDDGARAQFLKQVASELENKVGRIAFDYQTGTYRANQDAGVATDRTVRNRDLALQRLSEDEQTYKQDFTKQTQQAREQQDASLNQRGLLTTSRDQADGLAGKEIGNFEQDATNQLSAYERALTRNQQDVTQSANDQLGDIDLAKTRSLEDLTTGARRDATDQQNQYQYNLDSAKRALDQQKLQAEQQRRQLLNQSRSYADYLTRGATGLS